MTSASAASAPAACGTLTPSGPLPPPTVAAISASAIASERHDERASRDAQRPVSSGLAVGGGDRDRDRVALIAVTGGDALTEAARVALARPGHHDHECQAGSMSAPRSTRRRRTARRASPSPSASADRSPRPPPARSGSPRGSGSSRSPHTRISAGYVHPQEEAAWRGRPRVRRGPALCPCERREGRGSRRRSESRPGRARRAPPHAGETAPPTQKAM